MPREITYIMIGMTRKVVREYPEWQQGLPQHTTAEAAAYFLGFLKGMVEQLGPSLFVDDAYHASFVPLMNTAIQTFDSGDLQGGITQIEDQILPAVTQGVVLDNRIAFRDVLNTATRIAAFPGEYYFTPPLDEILSNGGIVECTNIRCAGHIVDPLWLACQKSDLTIHVEKVEPPEEE